MKELEALTQTLTELPGIGPRQAKRLAFFFITENKGLSQKLSRSLTEARDLSRTCDFCQALHFEQFEHCRTCRDRHRDQTVLMIVENDIDKESVERSNTYNGHYLVIGGSVAITESNLANSNLRLKALEQVLKKKSDQLSEVILAFNYTPQGEHTSDLLKDHLRSLADQCSFKITTLGRGLSTGTELEYSDTDTFRYALKNRG